MATIAEHIAARNDNDLLQRFIAAAEREGIANAQFWAEVNRGRLVSKDIGDTTVADVHAFAVGQYEPALRPGEDPAFVTDEQIESAVAAVRTEQSAPAE